MSILSWLLKSKKEMAKPNTKRVRLGKYTVSSHAQNRVVDPKRKMTKIDMVDNLFTKPNAISAVKTDSKGQESYDRVGKKVTTSINPKTDVVVTVRRVSDKEKKQYNLQKNKKGKYTRRK